MTIDIKHKIYSEPLIYSDVEFRSINCQYANINNLVRFQRCKFLEDVIWGDEINNEAYSRVESDMVYRCLIHSEIEGVLIAEMYMIDGTFLCNS